MSIEDILQKELVYDPAVGISVDEFRSNQAKTVLLVDDSEMVLRVLATKIKQLGYHVLVTTSDIEALELYKQHTPNVVTIDINLRGENQNFLDGPAVAKLILKENCSAKVVFISAIEEAEMKEIVLDLYAQYPECDLEVDYLTSKSPSYEELHELLT